MFENWTKAVIFKTHCDYKLSDGSVRHMTEGDMLVIEEKGDGSLVDHVIPSDTVPQVAEEMGIQEYIK